MPLASTNYKVGKIGHSWVFVFAPSTCIVPRLLR
uniref:Uncharacterized protein n=1 Tax=Arundo donax TaxID=35708 RepID=A0A0A8ZBJ0_ARUDO